MNSRSQTFELCLEGRQVDEAVASLFHTILFHRTLGKFTFEEDGSYSVGSVGYHDVDCDFIDVTYVSCSSQSLDNMLKREIAKFSDNLRRDSNGCGQISLEFYQRKKSHWPFQPENIPWEVWNIRLELVKTYSEDLRETVGMSLSDKIIDITEIMNRHEYLPSIPAPSELPLIFNTGLPDVQPYWFYISHMTSDFASRSLGVTIGKMLKTSLFP